jgi:hypothetical protein
MSVEQELIKVSRFKGEDDGNRQEYLEKLLMHVDTISNDKWKGLSDEAKDWIDAAVEAKEAEEEIPDFGDRDAAPDEDPDEDPETEEQEAEPDVAELIEDDATEPAAEDDEGGGEDEEASDAEGDNAGGEVVDEPEPLAEDDEPAEPPQKKAKAKAPAKAPTPKAPKKDNLATPRDYSSLTGEKDKYGVYIGTKTHEALLMFEKGCTQRDVMEKIGGKNRYYNILKDMVKAGHKVEKLAGGIWKLTHKPAKKGK